MKKFIMRYPGDPPTEVVEITKEESGQRWCDFCRQDLGPTAMACRTQEGHRAATYCLQCFEDHWLPFCIPAEEAKA